VKAWWVALKIVEEVVRLAGAKRLSEVVHFKAFHLSKI
jgi:hypothetical protein